MNRLIKITGGDYCCDNNASRTSFSIRLINEFQEIYSFFITDPEPLISVCMAGLPL